MSLIVQKFGGASVGSVERIECVAEKVIATRTQGHQIIVVVSAMSGETNRLMELANSIHGDDVAHGRELDVLLSTGEQVTIALLSMALQRRGCAAISSTGGQIDIRTDSSFNKARIQAIDAVRLKKLLDAGNVVVVAGFQGIDDEGNITTLGRGGSDTTAVALAVAAKADECQIYTDVDGVYTTDPRVESNARRLARITFEEMMEMASLGSKVLQIRAVEFAGKYNMPVRVLSSFEEGPGTLITFQEDDMEAPIISGIAFKHDEAQLTVRGIPDQPGVAARILAPISDENIEVDMIVQNVSSDNTANLTFTVNKSDYSRSLQILENMAEELESTEIIGDPNIVKLSLVGVGMRSHAGIASKMFKALADEKINIKMISTSEIKISVVIEEKYLELGVRTLHEAFELDKMEAND